MKKTVWVFAICALFVLSLTACGAASSTSYNRDSEGILGDDGMGPDNNTGANYSPNANEPVLPGNGYDASEAMPTYEQMLRNAHVHDSDGILTDGENSCSDV
ncbi:MAG: hypothetical protein GXW99_01170 [Clostridiales bacterium]|nr:hypothetical protein [Clostridiales bacterium]